MNIENELEREYNKETGKTRYNELEEPCEDYMNWLEEKIVSSSNVIPDVSKRLSAKLEKAEKALNNIIRCEQGDEEFEFDDSIEIANRALEAMAVIDGF